MSDWITHAGLAYSLGRAARCGRLRLLLLGGVLPDLATPAVVLANRFHWHPGLVEALAQPLQAPLPTLCFTLAAALLVPPAGRSLPPLLLGVGIHYLLDLSQIRYGGGVYLLYPLSYWHPGGGWYWPESLPGVLLLALGAVGLAAALRRPGPPVPWRARRWPLALGLAAAPVALSVLTVPGFYRADANHVDFFARPERYRGRVLRLGQLELVGREPGGPPYRLTLRKGERWLLLVAREFERWGRPAGPPPPGTRLSFTARVTRTGLHALGPVHVHWRPLRTWTSALAFLLLLGLLWPRPHQGRLR